MLQPVQKTFDVNQFFFRWLEEVRRSINLGFKRITSITASYTAIVEDKTIMANATSGAITVTLPEASTAYNSIFGEGMILTVVKTDSSGNAVTLDGYSTELINGSATQTLSAQYDRMTIQSISTAWVRIG